MGGEATIADEHAWSAGVLEAAVTRPQWRVWRYRAPEIVLGCSQRALRDEVARRAPPSLPVSVRASGGGAVLAGPWMVGVTVVLPAGHPLLGDGLVASYRWFGELHERLLREAGVDARALDPRRAAGSPAAPTPAPLKWACFGSLSAWEVVDERGRKLTGLAQQRRRTGVAYSAGTLVSRPDWRLLCEPLGLPDDAPQLAARTAACDEWPEAQGIAPSQWAARLDEALAAALG